MQRNCTYSNWTCSYGIGDLINELIDIGQSYHNHLSSLNESSLMTRKLASSFSDLPCYGLHFLLTEVLPTDNASYVLGSDLAYELCNIHWEIVDFARMGMSLAESFPMIGHRNYSGNYSINSNETMESQVKGVLCPLIRPLILEINSTLLSEMEGVYCRGRPIPQWYIDDIRMIEAEVNKKINFL